jgi:asparagine synthase (glutamine-hydrolysing)
MCGICGIVHPDVNFLIAESTLLAMRDTMTYRGPDDAGQYLAPGIALGSRRLAILDLSAQARMPMRTSDGRYWITYNGEVYNYREFKPLLESRGYTFRSTGDTEVLLNLYASEGAEMLDRLNGMFAFAIWDSREHTLFIARDRLGIKPLYYAWHQGAFYFASEEKALFAAGVPAEFDESVWHELLYFRYVAGERTPYRGVSRLLPGHYLILRDGQLTTQCWWSLAQVAQRQRKASNVIADPVHRLKELLDHSIALRRISDVPVGVLLSGGVDSSGIAATMARQAGSGVSSFTVRFAEPGYDEGLLAQQTAQRWHLDHHEIFVSPDQIPALLEEATWLLDEPLVHGNDLHLLAISRYAKPKVTVLLSGEGADEVFGGYVRYRTFLHPGILAILGGRVNGIDKFVPQARWRKLAHLLAFSTSGQRTLYSSAEIFPSELGFSVNGNGLDYRNQMVSEVQRASTEPVRQAMFYEQQTYLQSILDRNDRMTMGASIECRVPYLDYRLVEWAAGLSTAILFHNDQGKAILREVLKNDLPSEIMNHRKWGFGVPWHRYLREIPALRRYVEKLPEQEIISTCPLKPAQIQNAIRDFLAGDERQTPLVRELTLTALWHEVCVCGKREVLAEARAVK